MQINSILLVDEHSWNIVDERIIIVVVVVVAVFVETGLSYFDS